MKTLAQIAAELQGYDNFAMDGYAYDGQQLGQSALTLNVIGIAFAGKAWQGTVGAGQCVKIMTGAIMPTGLDTVVPQEFVSVRTEPFDRLRTGSVKVSGAASTLQQAQDRPSSARTEFITILPKLLNPVPTAGIGEKT